MRLPIRQRLLAGMAMAMFAGVFFVCPLHAAFTVCTMVCCHPHATEASFSTGSDPCPGDCAIRADHPITSAARSATVEHRIAVTHVAPTVASIVSIDAPRAVALFERDAGPPSAPLHLLNSIFRI